MALREDFYNDLLAAADSMDLEKFEDELRVRFALAGYNFEESFQVFTKMVDKAWEKTEGMYPKISYRFFRNQSIKVLFVGRGDVRVVDIIKFSKPDEEAMFFQCMILAFEKIRLELTD